MINGESAAKVYERLDAKYGGWKPSPIRCHHIGTITIQGDGNEIANAMQRYFGGVK